MFHISSRTGAQVNVVRVFVKPLRSSVQPVCSASRYARNGGCPNTCGPIQYSNGVAQPNTSAEATVPPTITIVIALTLKMIFWVAARHKDNRGDRHASNPT